MKFQMGELPKFKGKVKPNPLADHADFQKLCKVISDNQLKPKQYAGVLVDASTDGKKLKVKNPARFVRDNLNRFLADHKLDSHYRVIARQTAEPGIWAVGVLVNAESRQRPKAS